MLSYTARRNLFGDLSNKTDSTTLTWADTQMNAHEKEILTMKPWPFLYRQKTTVTVASTQFYNIPGVFDKLESLYVTVSSVRYTPRLAGSRIQWDELNMTSFTSDIPSHWFVFNNQFGIWPTPATSSNTITMNGKLVPKDLTIADYTTGTIVSIANGATTVTASGTAFTAKMVGRWIRITDSDTANTGDGQWYQISSVTSTTILELVGNYDGPSISAGAATFTIGQMSLLPEGYTKLPVLNALVTYFTSVNPDESKATLYAGQYADLRKQLVDNWSESSVGMVLDYGMEGERIDNPNRFIKL